MSDLATINDTLNQINRTLQAQTDANTRNLDEIEEGVNSAAALISRGIDFIIDFAELKNSMAYVGINTHKAFDAIKDGNDILGNTVDQLSNIAALSEVGYRRIDKDMLNLIALEEMAGRSDRNLLRFVDTIISQGADTRAQDDILDSLKSIKDSSMVTTQALLAALDPITAFQVQLQTLGGGVFENISQGITKLVDENELTASQAGNLGKLVAELLDPANSQVVAMLDVQSQINEMLTQGVTATIVTGKQLAHSHLLTL